MRRHYLLLLLALGTVTFVGCDSTEGDSDSVFGRWVETEDGNEFINISEDEIIVHLFTSNGPAAEGCFNRTVVDVISRDGDEWTIEEGSFTQTVTIRRDGDELIVIFGEEGETDTDRYERSSRTEFTPLCA